MDVLLTVLKVTWNRLSFVVFAMPDVAPLAVTDESASKRTSVHVIHWFLFFIFFPFCNNFPKL